MRPFVLALVATLACAPDPTLRVTPNHGPIAGGEPIRIEGDGFVGHGPPVIYVGAAAAKAVVIESRWLITAVAPPSEHGAGTVDVRIAFRDGDIVEIPAAFTYEEDRGLVLRPGSGD
jgi:hypothetical protein